MSDVLGLGGATWAVDLAGGGVALLIGILLAHDQPLLYISGRNGC